MRTIFKYELQLKLFQTLALPPDARPLCVRIQNNRIMVWVELDDDKPHSSYYVFHCVGTGHLVPLGSRPLAYLDTVQDGPFVWHFYWSAP